jgi:hypothetical protein
MGDLELIEVVGRVLSASHNQVAKTVADSPDLVGFSRIIR